MANDNQITDIDAESLCQMSMIATLALQNNNMSSVPPQLGNCTQLRCHLSCVMVVVKLSELAIQLGEIIASYVVNMHHNRYI